MRTSLAVTLAGLLALAGLVRAEKETDPRAIIDKAIKAVGGEEKAAKWKAVTWKEKGTYYGMGDGVPYVGHYAWQAPDQFHMDIEGVFVLVLNGDKGWTKMTNEETKEMTKEQLSEQREQRHASWLVSLVPLKDKGHTLTPLAEAKVGGLPAVGVKVSSKGHRDVSLYFDKDNGLVVKIEQRARAEEQGGKEVNQETFYSDYKEVDGVMFPMKVVVKRDGKDFVEAALSDVKFPDKLEQKLFAKP